MRKKLEELIKNSIIIKYKLPTKFMNDVGVTEKLTKSNLSSAGKDDYCLEAQDDDISKIIYNGIIEFAVNEFNIDYQNLDIEQTKVILTKLKYNKLDSAQTKLQYGFYGEVLLDLLLRIYFGTNVILARGYFYSPLEKSEAKGFDAFHFFDNNGNLELWFGEAKFHKSFTSGIKSVIQKMNSSITDKYMHDHMFAIINERNNISYSHPILDSILNKWDKNPEIILADELASNNVELVYPVFIAFQKQVTYSYEKTIVTCVEKINETLLEIPFYSNIKINVSVFVILLPVENSNKLKEDVIKWIETKEPLI